MFECPYTLQLSSFHDGELDADARRLVERHLLDCLACTAELEELRSLSTSVRGLAIPSLPRDVIDRLHRDVRLAFDIGIVRFARVLTGLAATILVIASGLLMTGRSPRIVGPQAWEGAAMTLRVEEPSSSGDRPLAEWIVADLSRESRK